MSKRSVQFSRPAEPAFLQRIKEQVGYKEGPTVDTKRQHLPAIRPEDLEDAHDEQPTVVVLQPGDLTADQADAHVRNQKIEQEAQPADLTIPIVFQQPKKGTRTSVETCPSEEQRLKRKRKSSKALLSFKDEDEEDN